MSRKTGKLNRQWNIFVIANKKRKKKGLEPHSFGYEKYIALLKQEYQRIASFLKNF